MTTFRRLMFGVLQRAMLDLEEATDRKCGRRPSFGQAHEFDDLNEVRSWFFDDSFFKWHQLAVGETQRSEVDGFFQDLSTPPPGFATLEDSDGLFSFRNICEYLRIEIEDARAALRKWIDLREAGGADPLLSPRWRTPGRDWAQARGRKLASRNAERNAEDRQATGEW